MTTPQELKQIISDGLLSFPVTDFDAQGNFRPDTYVALAVPAPSVDAVEHYLAKVQIDPSSDQADSALGDSIRNEPSLRPA